MEEVFAQARNAESEAEELLVDDGWKVVEVEPEAVAVNGNGHHDAIGIGPTVKLVLGNGRHANGNGHHDEAPEPQQSLFSWAEFMAEEPVKPKGRGHVPVRVGAGNGTGAGGGAGRRGTLDRNTQGEGHRDSVPSPCETMYAVLFAFHPLRRIAGDDNACVAVVIHRRRCARVLFNDATSSR